MYVTSLQFPRAVLLALAAAGIWLGASVRPAPSAPPVATPQDDKAGEEQRKLNGTWIMMTEEDHGRNLPAEKLRERFRLIIAGNRWALKETNGPEKKEWNVKLDAASNPKHADFTYLFGDNKERVSLGIYELKGDSLKLCIAEPGESRPARFDGKGKKTLLEFKRSSNAKPAARREDKPR